MFTWVCIWMCIYLYVKLTNNKCSPDIISFSVCLISNYIYISYLSRTTCPRAPTAISVSPSILDFPSMVTPNSCKPSDSIFALMRYTVGNDISQENIISQSITLVEKSRGFCLSATCDARTVIYLKTAQNTHTSVTSAINLLSLYLNEFT